MSQISVKETEIIAVRGLPSKGLTRANLYAEPGNGAGGAGRRPLTVDRRTLQGEELVPAVSCPDELPAFRAVVEDLDFDDVVRER